MAGGVSTSDARALAADMRTTTDFILSQPKLHFACHIRNVTPNAVSIPVTVGELEQQPRLDDEFYEQLRALNRERVSHSQTSRAESGTATSERGSHSEMLKPQHEVRPDDSDHDASAASKEW
jgi:hypothetical protein